MRGNRPGGSGLAGWGLGRRARPTRRSSSPACRSGWHRPCTPIGTNAPPRATCSTNAETASVPRRDRRDPAPRAVQRHGVRGPVARSLPAARAGRFPRALPATALRHAFLRRYPTAAAFDARAFKEFFLMNGAAHVLGVDSFDAVYLEMKPQDRALDPHPPYAAGPRIPLMTAPP